MRKFGVFSAAVFISIVLGGLYGVLHDQVTYSISPEYYTRFKFQQFGYNISEIDNIRLTAGIIGFLATWWFGFCIGLVLGLTALIFPDHATMKKAVNMSIKIVFATAVLAGVIGYFYGRYYLADKGVSWWIPDNLVSQKDFITVGSIHNSSYLGGGIGILIAIIYMTLKNISVRKMVVKKTVLFFLFFVPFLAFSQDQYSTRDLKDGKFKADSSYIYTLPFEHKKKVFLVQGYESMFSHKGSKALDFKVKTGTKVCAARGGVVIAMRNDSDKGGLKKENLADGNYVFIKHDDGSEANYWHFKKGGVLVSLGDTIQTGQPIGLSGNTGYSAFPHLHFEVRGYDAAGVYKELPTRFYTQKGIIYLRPGKFYRTR